MNLNLQPLPAGDWVPYEHIDPDGDILPVPADEQPVVFDDDGYPRDES